MLIRGCKGNQVNYVEAMSKQKTLGVSLISSYRVDGVGQSHRLEEFSAHWAETPMADRKVSPDLYLFMESEVEHCCQKLGIQVNSRVSALQFLAELAPDQMELIIDAILIDSYPPVAITTFLPEISIPNYRPCAKLVDPAISGLFQFALRVGLRTGNTPVVQMVAGNVIDGIVAQPRAREDKKESKKEDHKIEYQFYVKRTVGLDPFERILTRLQKCLEELEQYVAKNPELQTAFSQLRIAFEQEPGPLYSLADEQGLLDLNQLIEGHSCSIVRQKIGFNLDIAHWWLEGIEPSFLEQHATLKQRIFHSHISGHSRRAHFGDISLAAMTAEGKASFCEWLQFLTTLKGQDGYSGFVSLEYEAARDTHVIVESVSELFQMLDSIAAST